MTAPDYEDLLERFYTSLLRPGEACVDVGAHLGRHCLPMARRVGPAGRVYAFEPIPEIHDRLRGTLYATAHEPMAPVELYPVALGEARGSAEFVVVDSAPEYSGFRERLYDFHVCTHRILVPVVRLDEILRNEPRVAYIKIDAEGGEYFILRGTDGVVRRDRPVISFECGNNGLVNYPHDAGDIYDLFAGWDYALSDLLGRPLDREGFVRSCARQEIWDYVARPR